MSRKSATTDAEPLPSPTRRNWVWYTCQLVLQIVLTFWLRYRSRGIDRLPPEGGALLLINHQSFLDPLLVGLPLQRPVSYLARDSLFRVPVIGWLLRHTYVMPINRESAGSRSIKAMVQRMQHGFLVGIFPEGTRSADGKVGPLKPGFLAFIRRSNVPVYPVGIAGAFEAFPRHAWFLRPRKVCVVFGEPFSPDEIEQFSRRGEEERMLELARERIIQCQQEAESWRKQAGWWPSFNSQNSHSNGRAAETSRSEEAKTTERTQSWHNAS